MLQQPHGLCLNELCDHIAKHCHNSEETFIGVTNVSQTCFIEEDFLHDKDGNSFRELGPCLHDAEAEGYYFGGEKEVDDSSIVVLLDGLFCD